MQAHHAQRQHPICAWTPYKLQSQHIHVFYLCAVAGRVPGPRTEARAKRAIDPAAVPFGVAPWTLLHRLANPHSLARTPCNCGQNTPEIFDGEDAAKILPRARAVRARGVSRGVARASSTSVGAEPTLAARTFERSHQVCMSANCITCIHMCYGSVVCDMKYMRSLAYMRIALRLGRTRQKDHVPCIQSERTRNAYMPIISLCTLSIGRRGCCISETVTFLHGPTPMHKLYPHSPLARSSSAE